MSDNIDNFYAKIVKEMSTFAINEMAHNFLMRNVNNENKMVFYIDKETPLKVLHDIYNKTISRKVKERIVEIIFQKLDVEFNNENISKIINILQNFEKGN